MVVVVGVSGFARGRRDVRRRSRRADGHGGYRRRCERCAERESEDDGEDAREH